MRARQYYEEFLINEKKHGETEAFRKLIIDYFDEVMEIAKIRNAKRDSAMISILKEQNDKWNAMRKFDGRFKLNGFIDFAKHRMPMLSEKIK